MSFTSDSKQQISLKKLAGKAHTKNEAEFFNESKTSGLSVSFDKVLGEAIPESPTETLYTISGDTVEYLRLPLIPLPESVQSGKYHGFAAKLPAAYSTSSSNQKAGQEDFVNDKEIHSTNGKIQLIPNSFGNVYEAKLYIGGDATTKNSGTRIPVLDPRNWYFDYFNGILFQQNPPDDPSNNPEYIEAFVYVGKMADKKAGSLSSMWKEVSGELVPTGIIDGNTGLFAADFNIDLLDDGEVEIFKYTTTTREDAQDLYFELDSNGDITPKE